MCEPTALGAPQPLSGVRVVALGAFVAGNVCPLVLAELGADVVKIESRQRPESLRSYFSPDHDVILEPSGIQTTAMFSCLTRSMRSVCVEVDQPGGADTLRSLARSADILIENMGPGVMEKWGCSYSELAAENPRLVMLSISGYGRTGPRGSYRAYGSSIANYLGLASVWAHDGVHFDFVAAYHGAFVALGAWMRATHTGRGILGRVAGGNRDGADGADVPGRARERHALVLRAERGAGSSVLVCCSSARAGEDAWAAVCLRTSTDLGVLAEVLERPEFAASNEDGGPGDRGRRARRSGGGAFIRTPLQVSFKLQRAGPRRLAPVQITEDLWRDPQLRARDAFVEIEHPDIGLMEHPESPDRILGHPRARPRPGSSIGRRHLRGAQDWLGPGRSWRRGTASRRRCPPNFDEGDGLDGLG